MIKTVTKLSDGRELIYFDDPRATRSTTADSAESAESVEATEAERDAPDDSRDLPPVAASAHLRYDPILDEWVIIAAHRQDRTHLPPTEACPLCPSTPERPTEVPASEYDVVVFENRFPPMSTATDLSCPTGAGDGATFLHQPALGRAEVVCFTADHNASFGQLSPTRARTVVDAWADRTEVLSQLPSIEQVFPFENRGAEIGVTLSHPHGQIYAYPFVPARTQRMLESARKHQERTGRNLFADRLAAEQLEETRVVRRTQHWTAFVPYAARWPIEVHLFPHRHVPDLPCLTDDERDDFCELYLDILQRCDALYGKALPYIAGWHQAPVHTDRELGYLHLQLFSIRRAADKLKHLAGSESAMGVFVSDVLPERTAELLRQAGS